MLIQTIDIINSILESVGSRVRLQSINDKPPVFMQYLMKEESRERIAFFHICKPKKLLTELKRHTFSDLSNLNDTLNNSLGKLVIHKDTRACGKCDTKVSTTLHSKLAIIENADKLTLK